jgi:hypothetical protein
MARPTSLAVTVTVTVTLARPLHAHCKAYLADFSERLNIIPLARFARRAQREALAIVVDGLLVSPSQLPISYPPLLSVTVSYCQLPGAARTPPLPLQARAGRSCWRGSRLESASMLRMPGSEGVGVGMCRCGGVRAWECRCGGVGVGVWRCGSEYWAGSPMTALFGNWE